MSCLLMKATLITAAVAVAGAVTPPAVSVVATPVTVETTAQSLASASVATVLSNSLRISCSVVSDEEQGEAIENGLEVKATLLNEPPTVAAVLMNETPTVGVTLLNNVGVTAMRATEPLNVSLSEVCMVGDEEMTVLSASDQLLYYADGGYVRLNPE